MIRSLQIIDFIIVFNLIYFRCTQKRKIIDKLKKLIGFKDKS